MHVIMLAIMLLATIMVLITTHRLEAHEHLSLSLSLCVCVCVCVQAQELATCGAKVLHPRCIMPAALHGIPIEIHNTVYIPPLDPPHAPRHDTHTHTRLRQIATHGI